MDSTGDTPGALTRADQAAQRRKQEHPDHHTTEHMARRRRFRGEPASSGEPAPPTAKDDPPQ